MNLKKLRAVTITASEIERRCKERDDNINELCKKLTPEEIKILLSKLQHDFRGLKGFKK